MDDKRSKQMKKGDRVNVYADPITVRDPEGKATITSVPEPAHKNDLKGRPIFRVLVRFDGEEENHFRWVSESD
jgi:hypothetical protein